MTDGIDPRLVELANAVIAANRMLGKRLVVAESCTGGMVSAALTAIAGSSDVFEAGFITYANSAKISNLNVSTDILETFGSVSIATAWGMAQGALEKSDADVAVAITGIAGPDGGTPQKPVGTVVFARAKRGESPRDVIADIKQFGDIGRGAIRIQAALVALELLMPGAEP